MKSLGIKVDGVPTIEFSSAKLGSVEITPRIKCLFFLTCKHVNMFRIRTVTL